MDDLEKRLEEVESKLAFLEKELEEYKDANRDLYRKLSAAEEEILKLWKESPERLQSTPEITWDSEGNLRA